MKKQMTALGVVGVLLLTGCGADASEVDALRSQIATLTSQRDDARNALQPQNELTEREAEIKREEQSLTSRENDLNVLQDQIDEAAAEVDAREAAVKKREKAVERAELRNDEDWIQDVRQCLARDGDYKSASITWTDFSGADFSCYTG